MATSFTLSDGRLMAYRWTPPAQTGGPTVLLAGMLATTGAVWARVVPVLHASGFGTLAYDHPGHGGTAPPAVLGANTFERMADDVKALLDGVLPAPTHLHAWIGCSLGAATGVIFAVRHAGTVGRLVVCDTGSDSPAAASRRTGQPVADAFTPRVRAARASGTLVDTLQGTRERWLGREWLDAPAHTDEAAALTASMAETTVDGYETCIAALLAPDFDLGVVAPRVAASLAPAASSRVLVLVGERDEPLPASMRTLAEQIRRGYVAAYGEAARERVQFAVVPGAGHASFIDGFDVWCGLVMPFLQA